MEASEFTTELCSMIHSLCRKEFYMKNFQDQFSEHVNACNFKIHSFLRLGRTQNIKNKIERIPTEGALLK